MAINSDSLRRSETASDGRSEKQRESDDIERLTNQFLNSGGKIQAIPYGVSSRKLEAQMGMKGRQIWKERADATWKLKYDSGGI